MSLIQGIKGLVKTIIYKVWYLFGLKKYIQANFEYVIFQSKKKHTFFGYFDKSPFSIDGSKLLAITVDGRNGPLKIPRNAQVGYFNIKDPEIFHSIGESNSWCWQLGCRLMWYNNEKQHIIYNKFINGSYRSIIQSIEDSEILKEFDFPIYDISSSGDFGLTLNFSRLGRLRPGYGYINTPDPSEGVSCPSNDGVWICDLLKNERKLIIDLERIVNFKFDNNNSNTEHYINHLSFNPSGNRFLFFHIWNVDGKRYTRAITSDLLGQNLCLLNEGRTASHYAWKNDEELLMTAYGKKGFGYFLFKDLSNSNKPISPQRLTMDGHPGFVNGDDIITDSYPQGFFNDQTLLLDESNGELMKIASIHSSYFNIGEIKCDLHPRVDLKGESISVDFSYAGKRMMAIFHLKNNEK
jgi:hypothetical protein